jgi:uncharacterized protein
MPTGGERKAAVDRLSRFAASLIRHRLRWTVATVALLAAAAWLGSRLSMRQAVDDFLPVGSGARDTLVATRDGDRVVVVLESPTPLTAAEAGPALDELARRLARVPGIERVEHRVSDSAQRFVQGELGARLLIYFSPAELDTLASHLDRRYIRRALLGEGGVIPRSPMSVAMGIERSDPLGVIGPAIARMRSLTGAMPVKLVGGYFAAPDQHAFFLALAPRQRLSSVDSARRVVGAIDSTLAAVRGDSTRMRLAPGMTIYPVGRPVALVRGVAIAVRDVQRVAVASTVVVFLMLVLFLRRLAAPLLMIGTVLCGVLLTSAVAFLLYGSISLVSWLFIASLIGFGDEFALYIIAHYWLSAPSEERAQALASALRRPGPGILLGGLTSAGAFFSLIAISYPVMHQVAWLTTIGLLLILASSFTLLPLALGATRPGRDSSNGWNRWGKRAHSAGQRHRAAWVLVWLVLVAGAGWLARGLRMDLHPWQLAVRGVPATAELDTLSQRLGASFTPFTMIARGPTLEAALDHERVAVAEFDRIGDLAGVAGVVALSRWLPSDSVQQADRTYLDAHRALFSREGFLAEFNQAARQMPHPDSLLTRRYALLVAGYLGAEPAPITLATLDSAGMHDFVTQHLSHDAGGYLLRSEIYPRRVPWADGVVEQFTGVVARDSSGAFADVIFAGDALRGATHVSTLRRDAIAVIGLALLLTLVVLAARFRRVELVILCLLPLVCGVAAALVAMVLFHVELNMLTLAVAPLLIGLGSDDGIHIVDRLERREAPADVLADVSAPMVITTLTTIAGFACLGFASFPGVRETGLIAALGLLVCLVSSMQLVPMGYALLRKG